MRINGKFYGDQAKREAVDVFWNNADAIEGFRLPAVVKDESGTVVPARAFFDTQAVGCGWTPDGRIAGDITRYVCADAFALEMAHRMLMAWGAYRSDDADKARIRATLKIEVLTKRTLVIPHDVATARSLSREFREADRAFWKYALTRS